MLRKFFAATADHLFQPERVEYLNGYIGRKPTYYKPDSDIYVSESSGARTNYQLEATSVVRDVENADITHMMFYEDLINRLRSQGALVNDHNRLFEQEYYSFGLPIDIDKWLNFTNYVWLEPDYDVVTFLDQTSVESIQGAAAYTYIGRWFANIDPSTINTGSVPLVDGNRYAFVGDQDPVVRQQTLQVSIVDGAIKFSSVGAGPNTITLLGVTNMALIAMQPTYTYTGNYTLASDHDHPIDGELQFSTGMRVRFAGDLDVAVRNRRYIVEGVGRRIRLIWDDPQALALDQQPGLLSLERAKSILQSQTQQYVLMGRGSANQNLWSLRNRWFHQDVLALSGTVLANENTQLAKRPIIEFDHSAELWLSGAQGRGVIDWVDDTTRTLTNIQGQSYYNYIYNNQAIRVDLADGQLILFTNLSDPNANNRVYRVTNISNENRAVLQVVPNKSQLDGAAQDGDSLLTWPGSSHLPSRNTYSTFCYTNSRWQKGQSWSSPAASSQFPLFALYDADGNSLADPSVYPLSNFSGNTLWQYQAGVGPADPVLGFSVSTTELQASDYVFDNTLESVDYTYQPQNVPISIIGDRFWRQQDPQTGELIYLNNWFAAAAPSRQYVINQFVSTEAQRSFEIDQPPQNAESGPPPVTVRVDQSVLIEGQDFDVNGRLVNLVTPLAAGQNVTIRSWNAAGNTASAGYFEIPSNLEANPNNEAILQGTRSTLLEHFSSVIANQTGITGSAIGSNNWHDTKQDQSLGNVVLQHRAPMLKLMALNSVRQSDALTSSTATLDPITAMQWSQKEYLKFYNKFINSLVNLYNSQAYNLSQTPDQWVDRALKQINLGKTKANPWAMSGFGSSAGAYCDQMAATPTWIPPTPTRLGAAPAWQPVAFLDTSQPSQPLSLRCHNGAIVVLQDLDGVTLGTIDYNLTETSNPLALTHPVARAWMQLEVRLYNDLPERFRDPEAPLSMDPRVIWSAKWRATNYSRADRLAISRPMFERWSTLNQIDAFRNTTFDITNPFSWNYSSCVDKQNLPVPGHWRGIYFHFYDTDRPHQAPWEMLGFSQKPGWWDAEYGAAPYTSGNTHMWQDLAEGRIVAGPRQGVYAEWARPGLLDCLPVDEVGDLLPPFGAGVVTSLPSTLQASGDWQWGDRSPIENVWWTTVDNDFNSAQAAYLAKPAQFVEYLWDTARAKQVFEGTPGAQWIYTDVMARKSSNQFFVHRENPQNTIAVNLLAMPVYADSTYYGSCGIQHWISEMLINDNRDITRFFGNVIRGTSTNLAYRVGGFTDGSTLRLLVDSFGLSQNDSLLIPQEDVTANLLRSASVQEFFYTGVIIELVGQTGWRVIGYDSVDPRFKIQPSNLTGPKQTVVVDKMRVTQYQLGLPTVQYVPYGTVFATRQEVYDFLICLGRAQINDGWVFDQFNETAARPQDWSLSAREFLFWSQGNWAPGTFIALSPLASLVKFTNTFGTIQNVTSITAGGYSILDKGGRPIQLNNVDFLRIDNELTVRCLNDQALFGLRLSTTGLEHALVLNNQTIFGDTVYDPVLRERQQRAKLLAFRSREWAGRMDAPGYVITQTTTTIGDRQIVNNRIISDFEKSVEDIRTMYNIDVPTPFSVISGTGVTQPATVSTETTSTSRDIDTLAKHLIGYQSREYLNTLLVDNTSQYQFYQGMIQQKGTASSVDALLRNTNALRLDEDFEFYEEWAFRTGTYGGNDVVHGVDVVLPKDLFNSNPQLLEFVGMDKPNEWLPHSSYLVAASFLSTNKEFLKAEVTAYVSTTYPGFLNQIQLNKCTRDVGLIVDALILDLQGSTYLRSDKAGSAYWDGVDTQVPGQISQTVAALDYLLTLATEVVANHKIPLANLYQTPIQQVVDPLQNGDPDSAPTLRECIRIIAQWIRYGYGPEDEPPASEKTGDSLYDLEITVIAAEDGKLLNRTAVVPPFAVRSNFGPYIGDLPTAGYVLVSEPTYNVINQTELLALWQTQTDANSPLKNGDVVWQYIHPTRGWNTFKVCVPTLTVLTTASSTTTGSFNTTVTTSSPHRLSEDDIVVITDVKNTNQDISGSYQIFNVTASTFDISFESTTVGTGGNLLAMISTRFDTFNKLSNAVPPVAWNEGDLAYVDGNGSSGWRVYQYTNNKWALLRQENLKVDSQLMLGSTLYDRISTTTLQPLNLWDPVKGLVTGTVDSNINFRTPYDPARYNATSNSSYDLDPDNAWGPVQVGVTWWDLSTTRYLDYEIGSNSYRRQYWGQVAPGSSVDIYEWIRSLVPPSAWEGAVAAGNTQATGTNQIPSGQVKASDYPYVTRQERNAAGQLVPVYYFWVRNAVTIPAGVERNLTTSVLGQIITQPQNFNIPWWAPVSSTTVLLGNIGSRLNGQQTVWHMNYLTKQEVDTVHKQWTMMRPGDPRSTPTPSLWNRMRDSLVDWDGLSNTVPDLWLPDTQQLGNQIRPRQSWFQVSGDARRAFVTSVNTVLAASDTVGLDPDRTGWLPYFESEEPQPPSRNIKDSVRFATTTILGALYNNGDDGLGATLIALPTSQMINDQQVFDALTIDGSTPAVGDRVLIKDQGGFIAALSLQTSNAENGIYEVVSVGSSSEPWQLVRAADLSTSTTVGDNTFTNAQVAVTQGASLASTVWYQSNDNVLRVGQSAVTWIRGQAPSTWDRHVGSLAERDSLQGELPYGSKVLVDASTLTGSRWTIWSWDLVDGAAGWTLVRFQTYRTKDCWSRPDWYAAGYNSDQLPALTFDSLAERDQALDVPENTLVKVTNTGNGTWSWFVKSSLETSGWQTVAVQNGGIELSDRLWDYEKYQMGFGGGGFDIDLQGFEYDSRLELYQIIQGLWPNATGSSGLLKVESTNNERNTVFFDMIYHVFSEQLFVDWAFKTSFINLRGFAQRLESTPYYEPNRINSIVNYVQEAKPYHVKIAQFVDFRKFNENWFDNSTDFDKPPYLDNGQIRILDENNPIDQNILSNSRLYRPWYQNYQTSGLVINGQQQPTLVRKIRTQLILDRLSCAQTDDWYAENYDASTAITQVVEFKRDLADVSNPTTGYVVKVLEDLPHLWGLYAWDADTNSWLQVGAQSPGAANRIQTMYQPTERMMTLDDPLLISGCAPKGTVLDGDDFQLAGRWGEPIWDDPRGWSNTAENIDDLTDFSINGGQAPRYLVLRGDGTQKSFALPTPPQNPSEMQIWVDGVRRTTPEDWIVPNWITQVTINQRGIGYSVNEILNVSAGTASRFAQVQVINVNNVGGITSIQLVDQGSYTVASTSPVIPLSGGGGVGASVTIRWGGSSLEFDIAPPPPTNRANIFVAEKGSTFLPSMGSTLDAIFDGVGLSRPHVEGGHPEELMPLLLRDSLMLDVHTDATPGYGHVRTQSWIADGITDQFLIAQPIQSSTSIWVYRNGVLQTQGPLADYVINALTNRVVFVLPPISGTVTVVSVSTGGATRSVGNVSIVDPGTDYNIYDTVTLTGGDGNLAVAAVQVTAVSVSGTQIVDGGTGYRVGDLLLLNRGAGSQTLTLRVVDVDDTGAILGVTVVNPGYYTQMSYDINTYFTNGGGQGAIIQPRWGVAGVYLAERGRDLLTPSSLTQTSVTALGINPAIGTGLVLHITTGHVQETAVLKGDDRTQIINLKRPVRPNNSVAVHHNGVLTSGWGINSQQPTQMGLTFVPAFGDVVTVVVFASTVSSLVSTESFTVQLPVLDFDLANPPGSQPGASINTVVYSNGVKLRAPLVSRVTADGVGNSYTLAVAPTGAGDLTVWVNSDQLDPGAFGLAGSTVTLNSTPAEGSMVTVMVTDTAAQTYDYTVTGSTLSLASWAAVQDAVITVSTWPEDSSAWFANSSYPGGGSQFALDPTPVELDSVQLWLNGARLALGWDYELQVVGQTVMVVLGQHVTSTVLDTFEALYPTVATSRPDAHLRWFRNIYGDEQSQRLASWTSTMLAADLDWNSAEVLVVDHRVLPDASISQPGVIWIGGERVEYHQKVMVPTDTQPHRGSLRKLNRGSLGTATGVSDRFAAQRWNGTGQTGLFYLTVLSLAEYNSNLTSYQLFVDSVLQKPGEDYQIIRDPQNFAPGLYVEFLPGSVPPLGNENVFFVKLVQNVTTTQQSFPAGTTVVNGSRDQLIPGGYQWPYGNRGIQLSNTIMSRFLMEPGPIMDP